MGQAAALGSIVIFAGEFIKHKAYSSFSYIVLILYTFHYNTVRTCIGTFSQANFEVCTLCQLSFSFNDCLLSTTQGRSLAPTAI